jgi:hypothetical protein
MSNSIVRVSLGSTKGVWDQVSPTKWGAEVTGTVCGLVGALVGSAVPLASEGAGIGLASWAVLLAREEAGIALVTWVGRRAARLAVLCVWRTGRIARCNGALIERGKIVLIELTIPVMALPLRIA